MPLSKEREYQLAELFKNAPEWTQKPTFHADLAAHASEYEYAAGAALFVPNSPVEHLFLIAEGAVEQTFGYPGQTWFRKSLDKGSFLGQQALFIGHHQSRAMALAPTRVYRFTAVDVRILLEKYADLRDLLLREGLASRLRSIPLFESLADEDIRWLAHLVEAYKVPAKTAISFEEKPGLHIVDWGQVTVTGPVGGSQPGWRLTSGNFFLTPGILIGEHCAADDAAAHIPSQMFWLPTAHFERLRQAFPDISYHLQQPVDIAGRLQALSLLSEDRRATALHREHLAQYCAWVYVPNGQNVSVQGAIGYSFMVVHRGATLVSAVDAQGRLRPKNMYVAGQAFGTTSLIEGLPRDATVRAVKGKAEADRSSLDGAELIILDRRDLQHAFAEKPDLWHEGIRIYDRAQEIRARQPSFDWLEEEEVVVWHGRGHWLWLAGPLTGLGLIYLVFLLMVVAGELLVDLPWDLHSTLAVSAPIITGFIFVPAAIFAIANYLDDYYAVTNRRITRRDHTLFSKDVRTDALLPMVQDVTLDARLIGRVFGYGDVVVRTASKSGNVAFSHVAGPEKVRDRILQEKAGVTAGARSQTKEVLRRDVMSGLRLTLPVPDPDRLRALGENLPPPRRLTWRERLRGLLRPERRARQVVPPRRRGGPPHWFVSLAEQLPPKWRYFLVGQPKPEAKPLTGAVQWRKHWLDFLGRAGPPLLAVLFMALLIVVTSLIQDDLGFALQAGEFFLLLVAVGASLYQILDYRNDVYIVTDEKLIDIEAKPLGLSFKQRDASLDRVQTVSVEQHGFWAWLLNYGNVVIRTAAADEGLTFFMVANPMGVQKTISQKMDAFRRRQEERATAASQRMIIEGLEVYHEVRDQVGR